MKTNVLIVGAGPTGLLGSILLSQLGIDHVVIDRKTAIHPAPAAHVINTRTLEIYRQAGLDMDRVYGASTHAMPRYISWVTALTEPPLGQFDLMGDEASLTRRFSASRDLTSNISQNRLEEVLLEKAGASPHATILLGHAWLGFEDGNATDVSRVKTDKDEDLAIEARFTLAADGASSPIARALGISKKGDASLERFLNLTCHVNIQKVTGCGETLLYWNLHPTMESIVIVHDPENLSVVMLRLQDGVATPDRAESEKALQELFGEDVDVDILFTDEWNMAAQVAARFQHENVFLVGDAAHRFPPSGGLGLNTGAGDIHNLVWKINAVLSAGGNDDLLESYETERRPVALRNCFVSKQNYLKMGEIPELLGLLDLKGASPSEGVDRCTKRLASEVGFKDHLQEVIEKQREHFDMLGLELGYIYGDADHDTDVAMYAPSLKAGARLPHIPMNEGAGSTLDYVLGDQYSLLCSQVPTAEVTASIGYQHAKGLPMAIDIINDENVVKALSITADNWVLVRPDGHIARHSTEDLS
ncbi:MAG: FAD-dependent monooxygenase [Parvibaculaceae bacterium]|nr:FAD-dependent monooxygenase [Parvibaculaceae bacterium]